MLRFEFHFSILENTIVFIHNMYNQYNIAVPDAAGPIHPLNYQMKCIQKDNYGEKICADPRFFG